MNAVEGVDQNASRSLFAETHTQNQMFRVLFFCERLIAEIGKAQQLLEDADSLSSKAVKLRHKCVSPLY
jgi:hypothetical protein